MKKIFGLLFLFILVFIAPKTFARTDITDWYIKDFQSNIIVNKDSSLDITENITADCGDLTGKHGIFRVLPIIMQKTASEKIDLPINLISITDFNDKPIKYSSALNRSNHTITWKIGDPNVEVTGVNYYKITYHVKGAVLHDSADFDEFYYNLNGNFWEIPINNFKATVNFPSEITSQNTKINIYSGAFGEKNTLDPDYKFSANTLVVNYAKTLDPGQGITVSTTFPKNIIAPYVPTFFEKYGADFAVLIPILVLLFSIMLWKKYGRDPRINPTIAPEFEIPENLAPIEMGLVYSDGILKNNYISASIINLAVNGKIKIKLIEEGKLFKSTDYELTKTSDKGTMSAGEKSLFEALFSGRVTVKISDLKNEFYQNIPSIKSDGKNYLVGKKWLLPFSRVLQYVFLFAAAVFFGLGIVFAQFSTTLGLCLWASAPIVFIFSFFMPRRSPEGAVLLRQVKGFKLYMETAEKYRQKFNEKENIFEKFLPYAIMFKLTKEWIAKMKDIYGEKYIASYHPVWFYGAAFGNFDVDSLSTHISQMTDNMAQTITSSPSSSGSGGGGFSGGGGGGGGGGGW